MSRESGPGFAVPGEMALSLITCMLMVPSGRFENKELECLFRRYILRLQHASITAAVALFVVLTAALATTSFVAVQAPTLHNLYHSAHCVVFVVVFIFLCTRAIEDLYLNYVCYTILLFCTTFSVVSLPGQFNISYQLQILDLPSVFVNTAGFFFKEVCFIPSKGAEDLKNTCQ